jgi:hypothetical protein
MNGCLPDEPTLQRLKTEIAAAPPRPHHSALLAAVNGLMPNCEFRFALTRGGWYRPGALIRPDGERVANSLERWAEEALANCGDDLAECVERYEREGLLATRHTGKSHYFVADYGSGVADFVQLEIEELQEVVDRLLIDPANPPSDLFELTDPSAPVCVDAVPVGRPHYRFRRMVDIRQVRARQLAPGMGPSPLARFMDAWEQSQAAAKGHFSNHWVIGMQERQDRYHNAVLSATPVSRQARKLKSFPWRPEARGVALAEQVHAFDRTAGYDDAWYFHMVAGRLVPHALAFALKSDLEAGFDYLPASGTQLLQSWLDQPYSA